jgi:RNA polymerase sigma-70 factor, ECF subfamily
MSFWEERAAEQIGERLGLSAGNVRVIRHRALALLARCLQQHSPEGDAT